LLICPADKAATISRRFFRAFSASRKRTGDDLNGKYIAHSYVARRHRELDELSDNYAV
jgi:hypothetical protein